MSTSSEVPQGTFRFSHWLGSVIHTRKSPFPCIGGGSDANKYCYVPQVAYSRLNYLCKHMWLNRLCQRNPQQSTEVYCPSVLVGFGNSIHTYKSVF